MNALVIRALLAFGLLVGNAAARDASPVVDDGQRDIRQMEQADGAATQAAEGEEQLLEELRTSPPASPERMMVLRSLADAGIQSKLAQEAVLDFIHQDADARDCYLAIFFLRKFNVPAEMSLPALISTLNDHRASGVRCPNSDRPKDAAVGMLATYGPAAKAAIPALEWGIHPANDRPLDRKMACDALGCIDPVRYPFFAQGEAAIAPLIGELSSEQPDRRRCAATRLFELHEFAAPATPHLEKLLSDDQLSVRAAGAVALLAMATNASAVEVLEDYAKSPDVFDRQRLAGWLEKDLHFDDTKLLLALLMDKDPSIRRHAATRLLATVRKQQEVIEAMVDLFHQGSYEGQAYALHVFGSLDATALLPVRELLVGESKRGLSSSFSWKAERLLAAKFPEAFRDNFETIKIPSLPEQFSSIEAMNEFASATGDTRLRIERLSNGTAEVWSLQRSFPSTNSRADHTIYAAQGDHFVRLASIPVNYRYELSLSGDGQSIEFLEEIPGYPEKLPVFSVELFPRPEAPGK
ncbi:HEAT repeat domain-containing protein [Aeoliella sp. SH292]|uniref:HEAT repeat domain-containing protein n=1 Tax=Aeoliella sp. SH292 TaxID=3454464 RepID=UPI003F9D1B16